MSDENAPTGAEPEKDAAGAEAGKDVKGESSDSKPWHHDPRFKQDLGLLKSAKALLQANNIESLEDLKEFVDAGKQVRGKGVDLSNLDEIINKATRLDKYEEYWAVEREKARRSQESPDETLRRYEQELRKRDRQKQIEERAKKEEASATQAVKFYETEIGGLVGEREEISKEEKNFVLKVFGVGNASNEIDITDRKAVRKMFGDLMKDIEAYNQVVIQKYIASKKEAPKVGAAGSTGEEPPAKIKLKDAKKIASEMARKGTFRIFGA